MAEITTDADGPSGTSIDQPAGPVPIPISFSLTPLGTITQYTTVNVSIYLDASEATDDIVLGLYNEQYLITWVTPPTASWNNGVAAFQVNIDATLINGLPNKTTTIVVEASSGKHEGACNIPVSFP